MSDLAMVVFDVDGTLIDSQAHIVAALNAMYDAGGRSAPDRAALLSIVGLSLPQAIQTLEPDLDDAAIATWVATYKTAFQELRQSTDPSPLYDGARAVLDRLAKHDTLLLGVATGKSRRGLDHLIAAHDLSSYFVTLQTADHHPSKPHPAMLEAAMSDAGVSGDNVVMIGDTSFDMEMAAAAGAGRIGVVWGYHSAQRLHAAGAQVVVDHFADLPDAISDNLGIVL